LDCVRYLDWIVVNAMCPWGMLQGRLDGVKRLPYCTVAFEASTKGKLPHSLAFLDSTLGLNVGQFIPDCGRGCVSESVKSHS